MDKKIVAVGGGAVAVAIALYFLLKKPVEAAVPSEGDTKCEGFDLYTYTAGEWVLTETNSATCGYTPVGEPSVEVGLSWIQN